MSLKSREIIIKDGATAIFNSSDMVNDGWPGVIVGVDIDAISTGNITVTIQGKLPDGTYYTILQSAALSATGTTVLRVHPAMTASANVAAAEPLPQVWRISVTGTVTGLDANFSAVYTA